MFGIFQYLVGELLKSEARERGSARRMATTDELSWLPNRERFRTQVEEEIAISAQTGATFAVMLMDLDHFKEINDTLAIASATSCWPSSAPAEPSVGPDGSWPARR